MAMKDMNIVSFLLFLWKWISSLLFDVEFNPSSIGGGGAFDQNIFLHLILGGGMYSDIVNDFLSVKFEPQFRYFWFKSFWRNYLIIPSQVLKLWPFVGCWRPQKDDFTVKYGISGN